ncbi:lantibiotic dehydratase [Cryptosporangium sp. NPDC051539]|uniref:lantibiotic dehydratase n=1 Tax=Cryptosporangium sp. NPDC051539 TaxID=3363962 RepID=UPI0037BDC33D
MIPAPGAALIRIAAYPTDLALPAWPDLNSDQPDAWKTWLTTIWATPDFAAAVTSAAPQLAEQIDRVAAGEALPPQRLRRLVEAAIRYLLRWTTRATPFGTFAGVAPIQFGARAQVRVGNQHRTVTRPDGHFVAEQASLAEQDLDTLRSAAVVTNSLGYKRGSKWVLPCSRRDGDRRWDIEVGLTDAIASALQAASSPIAFADLATKIADGCTHARAEQLLTALIDVGALLTEIRPAMAITDPAAHLKRHGITTNPGIRVASDLRADVSLTLPPAVPHEASRAASALVTVAPQLPGWAEYHHAFIERWGPGAAVPIRDVLNVLGFPAGYRGSARRATAVFTARDRLLSQLAQQSALDGNAEAILDDELLNQLRGDDDRPPIPHTELRFTLAAETPHDLDRGQFTLTVLSGARHAGVSAARFLHLLDSAELAAFRQIYQSLPTASPGADLVQLSGPPLDARLASVARVPKLLPVLPVGEFHPEPRYSLDDLAVTGDGDRLWLVSRATSRPVEPLLLNSVLLPTLHHPLVRFLTEIWTAWSAPCTRFGWGHANSLPFLPRVRRGRAILSPARWVIDRTALPARTATWRRWLDAWQQLRRQRRLPPQIQVGADDVQLRLDLDDDTHLTVLRDQLNRHTQTVITEAPGSAGWIGGRPAEIVLTLTTDRPDVRPPRPARAATSVQHWPGRSRWTEAHIYGRVDDILTDLAEGIVDFLPAGWWFIRYPDPRPHLRLRIPLPHTEDFAEVARHLARWVQQLHDDGIAYDYSLHCYRPETRHGTGATLSAAEAVFAADSGATLRRLIGDREAVTAASMIAIAEAFTGDGMTWLTTHVPHRTGPRLDPAQLELARTPFRDDRLTSALGTYRSLAERDGLDLDQVLADLLHLHHARMIGVDTASEQHCLRLARTIAHASQSRPSR